MSSQVPEVSKHVIDVSDACYDEIRRKLIQLGMVTGRIVDRGSCGRVIDVGGLVVRNRYVARHATTEVV